MRTISPVSLEELCLSFICENIEDLCYEDVTEFRGFPLQRLKFHTPFLLHEQLAENIMKTLSRNGKLTTRTASLFVDPNTCRIRKFYLERCQVDGKMLDILFSNHRVLKLDLHGTTDMPSSLLIELLNEVASTVREINLSDTLLDLDFSWRTIWPLKWLTHLDISEMFVNDKSMSVISQCLVCLESINISNTKISETTSFGNLRSQLKVLIAWNAPVAWKNPVEFKDFVSLQKLDISRGPPINPSVYDDWIISEPKLQEMLAEPQILPDLVHLDISGTLIGPECENLLRTFIKSHPKLQFLGLCKTKLSLLEVVKSISSSVEITGEANEQQILSSLRAYPDRPVFMAEALRGLFNISKSWTENNPDVLQLVLSPMEKLVLRLEFNVQLAATACVYSIITGEGPGKEVHPTYLSKIAALVLTAMRIFPDKPDLLRNCLLILDSHQVLKKAKFSYFEASTKAMDALCRFSSDENIARLATKLCAILSSKISTEETLALGSDRNITTMFNIAQEKVDANQADFIFSGILSILWNFTDEAPSTCILCVQKGVLHIMAYWALKVFREGTQERDIIIKKKLLGTLNNIAEVPALRCYFLEDELMNCLGSLLDDRVVELSYFCGGIISNVMLDWSDDKMLHPCNKQHMLQKLEQAVTSWEFPAEELVAYRSFNPFVPLLRCSMPAVQMWALWGIQHVCSRNGPRYIPLLVDSGVMERVQELCKTSLNGQVSELAHKLVETVTSFKS